MDGIPSRVHLSDKGCCQSCKTSQPSCDIYEQWLSVSEDTCQNMTTPPTTKPHGDPQTQYLLGKSFLFGESAQVNEDEAFRCYELSAKQSFPPAQFMVALCYEQGIGAPKNPKLACENFQLAAANGLARAQMALKNRYSNTESSTYVLPPVLPTSPRQSKEGQSLLSHYFRGVSEKNETRAFKYFMNSALQGHPEGAIWVALSLFHGLGLRKNQEAALTWCKRAMEGGLSITQSMLALCSSFSGRAVTPEENKLVSILFQSMNETFSYEQQPQTGGQFFVSLAKCFMTGRGVFPNQDLADKYYKIGGEATFKLACCYEFGVGVEEDQEEAFRCYQQAADLDHVPAYSHLGLCYFNGVGVTKNIPLALSAIQTGVQLGNPQACYLLAAFYEEGRGVPKNIDTAMNYYSKAAHGGVGRARVKLEQLLTLSSSD